jgi:hypothetical protein
MGSPGSDDWRANTATPLIITRRTYFFGTVASFIESTEAGYTRGQLQAVVHTESNCRDPGMDFESSSPALYGPVGRSFRNERRNTATVHGFRWMVPFGQSPLPLTWFQGRWNRPPRFPPRQLVSTSATSGGIAGCAQQLLTG